MQRLYLFVKELWLDERSEGAVENGLVMAFIAAIVLGIISILT